MRFFCGDCAEGLADEEILVIHMAAQHHVVAFDELMRAPFPWFGGKRLVGDVVWHAFGDVGNYVEPFFGSGAVLLTRPNPRGSETVNDKDGYVANFWRALQHAPDEVARYASNPVNENDLHGRHIWLVEQKSKFVPKLEGDPNFYDAKIAGWWAWGVSSWIGSGFCSGNGPWVSRDVAGEQGVNRQLVHLAGEQGVNRKLVHLAGERGVNRQLDDDTDSMLAWMRALALRLRRVRVCSGDWSRVCGPTPTKFQGLTGVFLDPPYSDDADRAEVYSSDDFQVAHQVREWAIQEGADPLMRIALCGYEGEHTMPADWTCFAWKATGGYQGQAHGEQSGNSKRERIWFSPHCLPLDRPTQQAMFAEAQL